MKIKGIIVALATVVASVGLTSAVFAEDLEYRMGTPIDLSTGEKVTEFTAGQKIAVPVNPQASLNSVSYGATFNYDTNVLDYGVSFSDLTAEETAGISNLGGQMVAEADYSTIYGTDLLGSVNPFTHAFTPYGSLLINERAEGVVSIGWYTSNSAGYSMAADQEAYIFFTVKGEIDPNSLNVDLFKVTANNVDTTQGNENVPSEVDKANACFGAFNINIDSSALPYWIQALYVKVGGGEAVPVTEYVTTDNVNYTFPVRITSNSGSAASTTVEVLADVSSSETDSTNTTQESMGTFEVQLDSPTSYVDQTVSAQ